MAAPHTARSRLRQGLAVGLAAALIILGLWSVGWLDSWEAKTWDWRSRLLAQPGAATDDIRLILLDQNSLDWAVRENGITWPWPRELYGAIIDYCRRSGAKAVAFDALFSEPSRYGVADDNALGSAIGRLGTFAGALFLGKNSGSRRRWPTDLSDLGLRLAGLEKWLTQERAANIVFARAALPVAEISGPAAVLCQVHLDPDSDGVYRRVQLFGVFDDHVLPALGIGAYLAAHSGERAAIQERRLTIGKTAISIDANANAVLRFRGPAGTYRSYSAAAVLQSEIRIRNGEKPSVHDPAAFKNKYVLIGFTAPGLFDQRPAPVGGVYSGVEIHATMLDNLLSADFMQTTPAWLAVLAVFVLALAAAISSSLFTGLRGIAGIGSLFLSLPIGLSLGAYRYAFWFPLVAPESGAALAVVLTLVVNYLMEGRQKRFIKNAFQQYLSPAVIDQLLQNPERLKLGGERKPLSIFFSDLQGFTSISEGLDPEALTNLLNEYLSAMTDIIQAEGGTVDKYEGDAIIAFWNAPLDVPDHAVRVIRAALLCQARLAELRPLFNARIGKDMFMRIGINTGMAVVGNMGSRTRFDYTMLGDAVNLAARLEGVNKQFGTYTMMAQSTRQLVGNAFAARELARVAVVGRREPVTVYEPMFCDDFREKRAMLSEFAHGLELYYQGRFRQAQTVFQALKDADPPSAAYFKKCAELIAAAPADWQGVWVMTTK